MGKGNRVMTTLRDREVVRMWPSKLRRVLRRSTEDFRKIQEPVPLAVWGGEGGRPREKTGSRHGVGYYNADNILYP